jgi:hypothetical protein
MLPDARIFAVFLAAAVTLTVTPGPDMVYVASRALGQGRAADCLARGPLRWDHLAMDDVKIPIDQIYVPTKRREEIDQARVDELAEDILEDGLKVPISVRAGKGRYVLVAGLQRLEAMKALGEDKITAIVVGPPQH